MENIEQILGQDLSSLLKEAMENKFKFNDNKFHPAKIIANNDPEELGRVKVRVYGIYDDTIPDDDLPWAVPDFTFIGSSLGSFIVPTVDTIVNVYFENDDMYLPKYTTKVLQKDSLKDMSANYTDDYPDTMVFFETENGDYFKINRKTKKMTFRHASGLIITTDKDGKIIIDNTTTEGALDIRIAGDTNLYSQGDTKITTGPSGRIRLISGDGSTRNWVPNTMALCPVTKLPHGGTTAIPPITGLMGG
tara:strand:- start:4597 stop:5340 length:744 start_codon:yes stop_codon:yes gene_type:complete